jgi:Calcineurin-like phosphoesterase
MQQVILGLAALGTFCILYGFFIEPYWPEVTHVRIVSSKLAKSSAPIRIVHISDVHSDRRPRLENRLPALIAAQKPDVILFTGDSVNSPEGLPVFRQLMTQLAKICPTFAVRGNWDVWYSSDLDLFGGTGVIELKSWEFPVRVRETEVWVAGVPVDSETTIPTKSRPWRSTAPISTSPVISMADRSPCRFMGRSSRSQSTASNSKRASIASARLISMSIVGSVWKADECLASGSALGRRSR